MPPRASLNMLLASRAPQAGLDLARRMGTHSAATSQLSALSTSAAAAAPSQVPATPSTSAATRLLPPQPSSAAALSSSGSSSSAPWGALMAAAGLGAVALGGSVALCDAQPAQGADQQASAARLHELQQWLKAQGADLGQLEIRPSQQEQGEAGCGVFLSSSSRAVGGGRRGWTAWLWPFGGSGAMFPTVATFPLSSAITLENIVNDPVLGGNYRWMYEKGMLDERSAIMTYLLVEKLRGDKSKLAPWIAALPTSFHTPLEFSPEEVAELRGTTLGRAASLLRDKLASQWAQLEPSVNKLLGELGVGRKASLEDFVWAHGVFWSRGQSLPVPPEGSASRQLARDPRQLQIQEALVPGLDFCNHAPRPHAWWEVVAPSNGAKAQQAPGSSKSSGVVVELHLHRGAVARPGEEVFISYGEKGNEELLMLHGFCLQDNPHDALMLHCPVPPLKEWDDLMHARMELLASMGLSPQFFLRPLPGPGSTADPKAAKKEVPAAATAQNRVPDDIISALEVFVMDFGELNARRRKLDEERAAGALAPAKPSAAPAPAAGALVDAAQVSRDKAGLSPAEAKARLHDLGLRMAALTTLSRLLEYRLVELEGEEGSGPLEEDLRVMAAGPAALGHRRWSCVVYRAGQKHLARNHLVLARKDLQAVMNTMAELQDILKKLPAGAK